MKLSIFQRLLLLLKEIKDFTRLFDENNRTIRTLVFYSERDIYYHYYEGYINYILDHSDLEICYITSDENDPVFQRQHKRISAFYIKHLLAKTIKKLDANVLVMTMPDLDLYYIKRSANPVNHVYCFHGVGSIHLQYHKKAFNAYDTIFCIGPYDFQELRKAEEMYHLKPKTLVQCGYYRIEKIYHAYQQLLQKTSVQPSDTRMILVAPSWHPGNILGGCIPELIAVLKDLDYKVIIRPHPEFIKRQRMDIERLRKEVARTKNVMLELNMMTETSILTADVLITDWSAISFEYAFGTEKPVLFINTPCKIVNQDYKSLNLEPIELTLRNQIGISIDIEEIPNIQTMLQHFMEHKAAFQERIIRCREQYLYHWLHSAEIGGEFLINACSNREA
ncbi:MAG: hypothetical protein A2161_14330 [Candidatus Schekmanbacteria bacterium RBG_13_48_7]|uniref:CDP-glycerol--glycerophosphate glycerophosphotransferase n=1 Tax=Candidatus Schekmanbacteria bacterium RBG_13_48_7 TaxID=1817878 RepID=A0A1F7RRG3_9BACT|nr:MAG: hypothetical protein A2161_14330 [Candidatus Schekmanbacteria bacterium RBG_13_48_7]